MQQTATESQVLVQLHASVTPAMAEDVRRVVSLPLKRWQRWNHEIAGGEPARGNCHHAAAAVLLDLVDASLARGWRIGSGMTRMPAQPEPFLHSWLESPTGVVLDMSQVYAVGSAYAAARDHWMREFDVKPLISRKPGQLVRAVRRFGFSTAAVLPLVPFVDSGLFDIFL